jgi:hypothetical protein
VSPGKEHGSVIESTVTDAIWTSLAVQTFDRPVTSSTQV